MYSELFHDFRQYGLQVFLTAHEEDPLIRVFEVLIDVKTLLMLRLAVTCKRF